MWNFRIWTRNSSKWATGETLCLWAFSYTHFAIRYAGLISLDICQFSGVRSWNFVWCLQRSARFTVVFSAHANKPPVARTHHLLQTPLHIKLNKNLARRRHKLNLMLPPLFVVNPETARQRGTSNSTAQLLHNYQDSFTSLYIHIAKFLFFTALFFGHIPKCRKQSIVRVKLFNIQSENVFL
jgi:hypothetical protein